MSHYITEVHKVVVEKAGLHVDNAKLVSSQVIICSKSILVCFSRTPGFLKFEV